MLIMLLGIVDLAAALSLVLSVLGLPLPQLQAVTASILLLKGIAFIADVLSIIDVILAICMFALLWMQAPIMAIAIAVYLAFKGLYSFA